MKKSYLFSIGFALLAAILFGLSTPLAKLLLGEIDPIHLAAFLYLGSGLCLLLIKIIQKFSSNHMVTEARLSGSDLAWLAGATLAGGVIGPIILMQSLQHTPAATASLLLNFESVATTIIAAIIFKEAVSRRAWWAIITIALASSLLSLNLNDTWGFSLGAVGIIAASLFWGMDNNLTRNISGKDPITIVTIKGLSAGLFSLILAISTGKTFPSWEIILKTMLLGGLSYGLSILFYIRSLRSLGAARTSGLYSTAPLSGLVTSLIIFREPPNIMLVLALPLMAIGTALLVNELHDHTHIHEPLIHDHSHNHDDGHHDHSHSGGLVPNRKTHSHMHEHPEIQHEHHHMPDTHHRHSH